MNIIKKALLCLMLLASNVFAASFEKKIITVRQYQRSSEFALLDPDYDQKKIVVHKVVSSKPSRYISYITDREGNDYVIKQKRSGGVRKQFQVIFEEIGGFIADEVKIFAHRVKTLTAGKAFPGKVLTDRAASIVTLVPGVPASAITSGPYVGVDMRQSNRPDWPQDKLGLNKKVIESMSLHPDLPRLAAFHTFYGIKGGGPANYFYDKETDHFYLIDLDKAFNSNGSKDLISKIACDQIRRLSRSKTVLSQAELQGLQLYKETLEQLMDHFPAARIHELMDEFSLASGFKKTYVPEIASRVERIKNTVTRSHEHIFELIDLIAQLIRKK